MAQTKYTYSVNDDTLNSQVSPSKLEDEIRTSAIVTALDYIIVEDDDLDIYFKDAISTGDETLLTSLVAAHDGIKVASIETQKDSDGAVLSRLKLAKTGNHFQGLFATLTVGKGTIKSKHKDGSDIGFWTVTRYDDQDQVTTTDSEAVKTKYIFAATHDIAIMGATLWQKAAPGHDLEIFVEGAPDIPLANGGEVKFLTGGANIDFMGAGQIMDIDGKVPKDIKYDGTYYSHRIELVCVHPVSTDHKILIEIQYFKPPGV